MICYCVFNMIDYLCILMIPLSFLIAKILRIWKLKFLWPEFNLEFQNCTKITISHNKTHLINLTTKNVTLPFVLSKLKLLSNWVLWLINVSLGINILNISSFNRSHQPLHVEKIN